MFTKKAKNVALNQLWFAEVLVFDGNWGWCGRRQAINPKRDKSAYIQLNCNVKAHLQFQDQSSGRRILVWTCSPICRIPFNPHQSFFLQIYCNYNILGKTRENIKEINEPECFLLSYSTYSTEHQEVPWNKTFCVRLVWHPTSKINNLLFPCRCSE